MLLIGLLWVAPVLVMRPTDVRAVRGIGVLLFTAFLGVAFVFNTLAARSSSGFCGVGGGIRMHAVRHDMHLVSCWALRAQLGVASMLACLSAPLCCGVGVLTTYVATPVTSSSSEGGVSAARGARTIALVARTTPRVSLQQSRHMISAWLLLSTLMIACPVTAVIVFQVSERVSGPAGSLVLVAVVMLLLPTAALLVSSRRLRGASQWWLGMHGVFDETAATATLYVLVGTSFRLALQDARRRFRAVSGAELLSGGVELFHHPSLRAHRNPGGGGVPATTPSADSARTPGAPEAVPKAVQLMPMGGPSGGSSHAKARPAALGEIDAFLSHSSQDVAEELLEAFRGWARDFTA